MHKRRIRLLRFTTSLAVTLAGLVPLAACGGGNGNPTSGIRTYKYAESLQCSGGGLSLAEMQQQLAEAGILVLNASCGVDGNMRTAVCGAPDGRIGIIEIPSEQLPSASGLGFAPLTTLPAAVQVPCR